MRRRRCENDRFVFLHLRMAYQAANLDDLLSVLSLHHAKHDPSTVAF